MSMKIEIRDVPDEVAQEIEARAALAGLSMSDFILRELRSVLARPTRQGLPAKIAALPQLEIEPSPASMLREERERR